MALLATPLVSSRSLRHYFILHRRLVRRKLWCPLLFRDDPAYDYQDFAWSLNRPSISAYTAATVLLASILAVVYITEIVGTRPTRSRGRTVHETVVFFAIAGALPLLALLAAAAFPSISIGASAPVCTADHTNCTPSELQALEEAGRSWLFHLKEGGKALIGILIGGLIAFICGIMIFAISSIIAAKKAESSSGTSWISRHSRWLSALFCTKAREEYPIVFGTLITLLILGSLPFILPLLGISLAAMARPGAAICILFGVLVVFYFLILLLAPALRFIGVIAFLAWHAFVGADRYINELPGFKTNDVMASDGMTEKTNYYGCLLPLDDKGEPIPLEERAACPDDAKIKMASTPAEEETTPPLLDARAWVDQWRPSESDKTPKKLVVIATQGGAYRATFWTSLILDELTKKSSNGALPGLADHVALLTGASGGMVASAYFAAMSSRNGPFDEKASDKKWYEDYEPHHCGMNAAGTETWMFGPVTSQICRDVFNAGDSNNTSSKFTTPQAIARDSLTPVAAQTILYDMGRVLMWPTTGLLDHHYFDWDERTYLDRGLVLERQWGTLHKSYGELAKQQEALRARGERHPSMIISPMIADTGQPILISNLDLECLVNNGSSEAVSMFKWFPDIRDHFRLQTAVRMNASFPYISPAVSLPTTVRRRVVDAGYYDNYGVNPALSWLFQDAVIEFLADADIEGLVIIQIRAFPGKDFGQQALDAAEVLALAEANDARITRSMTGDGKDLSAADDQQGKSRRQKEKHKADLPLIPEWLTSPLTGVLAARSGSMAYRNNSQIDRLKKVLEARGRSENFVQSFVFENHADTDQVGVSWHITPQELAALETALKSEQNRTQFRALEAFWN